MPVSTVAVPARGRRRLRASVARWLALPVTVRVVLTLTLLVVASAALRSTAIHARFWIDEGLSVGIAAHPLLDIPGLLLQDGSPPLYYMLLAVWTDVFGTGEADTHALSLGFALLTVPAAFLAAKALFGARAGWIGAVLAAVNPFLTYYAQETRMYALVAFLSLLTVATFALAFAQGRRTWLPGFAVSTALLVYTHNWGLFVAAGTVVALVPFVLAAPDRGALLKDAALAYGAIALVYLPWLPSLLSQAANTGAPWAERPPADEIVNGLAALLGGPAPAMALGLAGGAGAAVLLGRGRTPVSPRGKDEAGRAFLAIAITALTALLLAWVASQASPAWANRYFAAFVGPVILLGAAGLSRAGRLGLFALVVIAIFWLDPRTDQLEGKSNAHTTAVLVENRLERGDVVVNAHPEQGPLMAFYLPKDLDLRWWSALGPVPDPQMMDWRKALARLRAARPEALASEVVSTLRPGDHLLLIQPIIRTAKWGAPWTRLVRRRAAQWERALGRDDRLVRTLAAPRFGDHGIPRGVRAVLYEAVPALPG